MSAQLFSVVQSESEFTMNYIQTLTSTDGRHWFESQHHTNSSIYLDRILKTTFLFKQLASGKLIYQFCIFFCIKDFKHFPVLRSWSCRLGTPAVPSLAAAKKHSGL